LGETRGVYRVLVGKGEGKRPLGRPRRGWEGNVKMDLQNVGCEDMDWIELAPYRAVAHRGVGVLTPSPRNSEVLTKLSRISISV
jgi:hypothetical protein